jgi:SpoVK/Ycf46/Vps4 family AAA+-type ATPase
MVPSSRIEDIKLRAEELNTPVTYELVRERKEDIIRSEFADVIEILEPTFGFELIGGMESVKNFFRSNIIRPLQEGNRRRAPMGVLLTGPAGTGKSAIVMAAAKESGVNCINLNLARILGQYVGMSERNLEKALRCIEALAPALVFIDEIDQAIQRGSGASSAVSNRIFKRILEFMSDTGHRGRIVFLAATNRPDLMDAALKRPGRFDKKIPCLAPDEKEREAIFRVMLAKYGIGHELSAVDFVEAARATESYTGAEIEAVVIKAFEVAEDNGSSSVRAGDLKHALEAIRPSTTDIEFMTLLALSECNDKDLLPERYRTKLDDRGKLEQEIQARTEQSPRRGRREL